MGPAAAISGSMQRPTRSRAEILPGHNAQVMSDSTFTRTAVRKAVARLAPLAVLALAFGAGDASALASSAQVVSPRYTSVAGGESQVFTARFLDASGRPAAGEAVRFTNDACGLFPNAQAAFETVTDANGMASARFTASNPPGITCWINATSGAARAIFDVLTYRLGGAYMSGSLTNPGVGQSVTVNAAARFGVYSLANVDVSARIIPGSGDATIAPASKNSGDRGTVEFVATPDASFGSYAVELDFRGHKLAFPVAAVASPWQDMWWAGAEENGWGISIVQHDDRLFAVLYAYDDRGQPTWWVIPVGTWNAARTAFSGAVYAPRGSPFHAYDATRFEVGAPVGEATLTFESPGRVMLEYSIAGTRGRTALTRQLFGPLDVPIATGVGDMWWGGMGQNGWGLAVLQQHRTLFMAWFTYDASGAPTWYVMPQGAWTDATTYEGRVYRATSSPWLGKIYDRTRFATADVGSFRFRLTGDSTATFAYSVEGRSGVVEVARQGF